MGSRPLFSAAINGVFVTASGIKQEHRYKYFLLIYSAIKWKPLSPTSANDNIFLCKVEFQVNGNVDDQEASMKNGPLFFFASEQ